MTQQARLCIIKTFEIKELARIVFDLFIEKLIELNDIFSKSLKHAEIYAKY